MVVFFKPMVLFFGPMVVLLGTLKKFNVLVHPHTHTPGLYTTVVREGQLINFI